MNCLSTRLSPSSWLALRSSKTTPRTSRSHYSQAPRHIPPSSSAQGRGMLPYFVGGLGGVTAVALIGYGYYHFSGAKQIVDGVKAAKDRYVDTKAAVAEKSEAARDKMGEAAATAKEIARQRRVDLSERWSTRLARKNDKENQDRKKEHEDD